MELNTIIEMNLKLSILIHFVIEDGEEIEFVLLNLYLFIYLFFSIKYWRCEELIKRGLILVYSKHYKVQSLFSLSYCH